MRSRSSSILDIDGEAEFVNEEEHSSENEENVEMPETREKSKGINYREAEFSSSGYEEEETFEGFNEADAADEDSHFLEDLVDNNGKIDKVCISREVDKTLEYLVTMQGEPYPLAQWIPAEILYEIPNSKGCLIRFNEVSSQFSFYVAETHKFSTKYDSQLHIVGNRRMDGTENEMFLFQIQTYIGNVYFWEMDLSPSSPKNIIDHYKKHLVLIDASIPEKRPSFNEAEIKFDKDDPSSLDYFKSKQGFVPRDYQIAGINWLLQCFCDQHGCILADEMGLGKTIQAICFLKQLHKFGWYGPHIIVVRNNTYNQWCSEIEEWSDFNFVMYKGDPNDRLILRHFRCKQTPEHKYKFNVLLVAYDILIKDYEQFKDIKFEVMLIDEGHRIKQRYGQTHLAFDSLSAQHRIIMTGTPIQNNLQELWSLLNFVSPDYFATPELFPDDEVESLETEKMEELRASIAPHLMRRSLEDVEHSIVPKDERFIFLELTKAQKDLTRLTKLHQLWRIQGADRDNYQESQMLHRICNHPFMVEGAEEYFQVYCNQTREEALVNNCCKFLFLDKVLPIFKREGRSVLIFSQRIKVLNLLAEYCTLRRYTYVMLDGQLSTNEKKDAIDLFSDDNSSVFIFLISTKSGAEGLNLTKASVTIIFDPDWNPNNDLQALGRCHRIGQTKQVLVLRLITYGTYEHSMYIRAQKKLKLWNAVLGDGKENMSKRATSKPRKVNNLIARPYVPIRFSVISKIEIEKVGSSEKIEPPPCIEALKTQSKSATIDEVLSSSCTVVKDISTCTEQEELSFDEGESKDEFLSRFMTDEVNLSHKRKRKTKIPAFTIETPLAIEILSALEKYGYGEYEKIIKEANCKECPIEILSRFCADSVILFFRALEQTGFLQFPLVAERIMKDKNCTVSWLMCQDREEWLSVPIAKRGTIIGCLKPVIGSIYRTAPYFLQSLENRMIVSKFIEAGLSFNFEMIPPPFLSQAADDQQILNEILENAPSSDENRVHLIIATMKSQLIEAGTKLQQVFCPLWGRPEIMAIFGLLKNFGSNATKMASHEIAWRTGIITKNENSARVFLARLFTSLRKDTALQQMKVPTNATGGVMNTQFIDYIIIEQKEMASLLHKTEIMSLIPKALENIPDNDELVQVNEKNSNDEKFVVDNKGWFTNKLLRKMLIFIKKFGIEFLVNLLLSDEELTSHLTALDIQHCEHGIDIVNEGNIPDFLCDDSQLLTLIMKIANISDPVAEMKATSGKIKAGHFYNERSNKESAKIQKIKGKQPHEPTKSHHHPTQRIKMTLPRITVLRFHNGKGLESRKEIDLSVAKWKRNIPVDERRLYLTLLQGKK